MLTRVSSWVFVVCSIAPLSAWAQEAAVPPPAVEGSEPVAGETSADGRKMHLVAEETPRDERKMHLVAEAPSRSSGRSYHYHDGFYARVNVGYGFQWGAFDPGGSAPALDFDGSGLGIDLLIGGSPSPGVALGGALLSGYTFTSDGGADAFDPNVQTLLVGPFIDGFPNPAGGWHFGGTVGLASIQASDRRVAESTWGVGGAAWAGFDQWVGDEFAVGGLVRFSVARTAGDGNATDTVVSAANLGLFFTALYH
jgi:hypothetical protein